MRRRSTKKVLVVASTFPASDTDPVPAFVKDQVIALKAAYPECDFSVLAPHDARSATVPFRNRAAYDEYRFHYFWPRRLEKLAGRGIMPALKKNPAYYLEIPFLFLFEFMALLRLTKKLKPDVIYAHWFTPQVVTAGMVSSFTKVPFVFTTHSSDVAVWHKVPLIGGFMVRRFTAQATALTAVSRRSLAKLQSFFSDEQWKVVSRKSAIIPMGVDLPADPSAAKSATRPHNILFIGRLAEKKGVQYLIPAFAQIQSYFPSATLTIAGDGPLLESLKRQAAESGLTPDKVVFSGYVSGQRKAAAIAAADIFVVPSIIAASGDAEGLPVALMEGLAAGKLCIATNESGADDIIQDGVSGYLLPEKDVPALAAALTKALSLDPATKSAICASGRTVAEQFAWPVIARRHYEHLLAK